MTSLGAFLLLRLLVPVAFVFEVEVFVSMRRPVHVFAAISVSVVAEEYGALAPVVTLFFPVFYVRCAEELLIRMQGGR